MERISIASTCPVYTLGTASSLSGIPGHSIRQYIEKGLIVPYLKDTKRHLFSEVDVLRLKYIHSLLVEDGLNIAGIKKLFSTIPCWAVRMCSPDDRAECHAFNTDSIPCWEASSKGPSCRNDDCRECEVYRIFEKYPDVKSFLKSVLI